MNKKDVEIRLHNKLEKYEKLVWYARSSSQDINIKLLRANVERLYEEETNDLCSMEDGDWSHGFNSGMMAGLRYALGLMSRSKMENQMTEDDFPFLDT